MSTSASFCNYIYFCQYYLFINMIEEAASKQGINNSFRMKFENKKHKNDVGFYDIVKFLNEQKAVMDYASLN